MRKLVKLNQKKQKNNYISLCNPPELKKKKLKEISIESMRNPFQLSVYFLNVLFFASMCDAFKHFYMAKELYLNL